MSWFAGVLPPAVKGAVILLSKLSFVARKTQAEYQTEPIKDATRRRLVDVFGKNAGELERTPRYGISGV
jgi:hypothetical protein